MRRLLLATLAGVVLLAGCGGTAHRASSVGKAVAVRPSPSRATRPSALAFARCMRASGVPNFPDPLPGRGLLFPVGGLNPSSPAVQAAHAKCLRLLPNGGPPGPGSTTHPSPQTLAKLVGIARCMREHGISQFPDPRTSVPSPLPAGINQITDFDGAILLFPSTLNLQAPAYRHALTACSAPPLGLPH